MRGPAPAARSAPTSACSASTTAVRPRTPRPAGPRPARTGSSGARRARGPCVRRSRRRPQPGPPGPPTPAGTRQVRASRSCLVIQAPVGGEIGPQLGVADGVERGPRRQLPAVALERGHRDRAAQRGRAAGGDVAEDHPGRVGAADDLVRAPRCRPRVGPTRRVRPGVEEPDRQGVGPRVLAPPFEHPDRQGTPLEIARDHRATAARRPAGSRPAPARTPAMPAERGRDTSRRRPAGPSPTRGGSWAATPTARWRAPRDPSAAPTNSENPSAATGSKRCCPTSRCQRAASPRNVRPMLPVPRPPIGTPAHSPSSTIGVCTRGRPTVGHGTPIPRLQATAGMTGQQVSSSRSISSASLISRRR